VGVARCFKAGGVSGGVPGARLDVSTSAVELRALREYAIPMARSAIAQYRGGRSYVYGAPLDWLEGGASEITNIEITYHDILKNRPKVAS
jgi:hypothetical protein